MEKIDKATLDVFLAWKGWLNNTKMLAKDSDVAVRLLDQELTDYSNLAEYDLQTSLKVMANRLRRRKEVLDKKPELEETNFATQQTAREAKQAEKNRIKDLIAYGSRGKYALSPSSSPQLTPSNDTGTATDGDSNIRGSWIKKWGGKAVKFFSGR